MRAYIYQADIYCEDCGRAIRKRLKGIAPPDPRDECSYDSDDFPKGPYDDGGGEADSPQHCGRGADCLNAITLSNGAKVGAWLENPLTAAGAEYVDDVIPEGGEVITLWRGWYAEELANHWRKTNGLYPPARVREAFADVCRAMSFERSAIGEASERGRTLTLNWDFTARRWGILLYDRDEGSRWFAYPTCHESRRPC